METLNYYWEEKKHSIDKITNEWNVFSVIKKQAKFYFVKRIEEVDTSGACFVVIESSNSSKEELLNEYNAKLRFPYFGFNWDALWDILSDLHWIEQKRIVVYHKVLPQLCQSDLNIYMEILRNLVGNWGMQKEHSFEVYFDLMDYEKVKELRFLD